MMIAGLTMALMLQTIPTTEPNIADFINAALPEIDDQEAWEYLGAQEVYTDIWYAASDYWLHEERMGGRSIIGRFSARPAFGQNGFRQVVIRRYAGDWVPETNSRVNPYVYAQRLSYQNADAMEAFGRAYPTEDVIRAFGSRTRISDDWEWERERFYPDEATVIRLIQVRRETLDERTCPALVPALERLNMIDISPVHIRGYGPDRRPVVDVGPDHIVITGDGTGFELEIPAQGYRNEQMYDIVLRGNHTSVPAQWIEQFEAETADCWRPDDGGDPPG